MGEMRDSDWSRENLLRSDWSGPSVATITTKVLQIFHRLTRAVWKRWKSVIQVVESLLKVLK